MVNVLLLGYDDPHNDDGTNLREYNKALTKIICQRGLNEVNIAELKAYFLQNPPEKDALKINKYRGNRVSQRIVNQTNQN